MSNESTFFSNKHSHITFTFTPSAEGFTLLRCEKYAEEVKRDGEWISIFPQVGALEHLNHEQARWVMDDLAVQGYTSTSHTSH